MAAASKAATTTSHYGFAIIAIIIVLFGLMIDPSSHLIQNYLSLSIVTTAVATNALQSSSSSFSSAQASLLTSLDPQRTATVIIPRNVFDPTFEPQVIKVVLGVNNTVVWTNNSTSIVNVRADDYSDPDFFKATYNGEANSTSQNYRITGNILGPGQSFNFTFTKLGVFGYHALEVWLGRGIVVVLPSNSTDNNISNKIIEDQKRERIEFMPLTVYIGDNTNSSNKGILPYDHDKALPVYAVQAFVLNKTNTNTISTYLINPSWEDKEGGDSNKILQQNSTSQILTNAKLTDENELPVSYRYTSSSFNNNTLQTFDAICPTEEITTKNGKIINVTSIDKETMVSIGPKIILNITNGNNFSSGGILYYNYSLGVVKPNVPGLSSHYYHLTFVSPYLAQIRVLSNRAQVSYGHDSCNTITGKQIPLAHYDIMIYMDDAIKGR